jgi:predicted AlkP superfamily pyrophosphatase or phosphodiesterase
VPLTLPPHPKALGTISHVFSSALASVLSEENPLGLRARRKVLVILVDGLGVEQIKQRAGHAPWLASQLNAATITHCAFPATTSVNVGSFATGLMPGEHGLIGHLVWDRVHDERMNLLVGWNERTDPLIWQPHQTIPERAVASGVAAHVVTAGEYRDTPYTKATMRGAQFHAAESWEERFQAAREILSSQEQSITYLYIPELDKYGHKNGWTSSGYATMLEDLDVAVRSFASKLPSDSGVIITADHGMIETTKDRQLVLDDLLEKGGHTQFYGGDTRVGFVYLDSEESIPTVVRNLESLSYGFDMVSTRSAIEAGWFGQVGPQALARLPELLLLAKNNYTLYHSKYFKPRSFEMISHHGALSPAETRIPLIRLGF